MSTLNRRIAALLFGILTLAVAQMACIPQDCMGSTFKVRGKIIDQDGNPIPGLVVHAYGGSSYEKPGFDLTATSDASGKFATDSVFRYGCSDFSVDVLEGHSLRATYSFYPPSGEGNDPELPKEFVITLKQPRP